VVWNRSRRVKCVLLKSSLNSLPSAKACLHVTVLFPTSQWFVIHIQHKSESRSWPDDIIEREMNLEQIGSYSPFEYISSVLPLPSK